MIEERQISFQRLPRTTAPAPGTREAFVPSVFDRTRAAALLLLACISSLVSGQQKVKTPDAASAQVWDPPAIGVFPDHNLAAASPALVPAMVRDGELLFKAKFNILDGAGRPAATGDSKPTPRPRRDDQRFNRISGPDANSCAGCHNQPRLGGSGEFVVNVFVGAHFKDPPASSFSPEITNERNTIGLFGSGAIEMLAREITRDLQQERNDGRRRAVALGKEAEVHLLSKGIDFGTVVARPDGSYDESRVKGIDPDLVAKPFGFKGVAISLREFTIAALNQHHGIQAVERFGWERTGRRDFDEDGVSSEFTIGQLSALVLFQAALPAPRNAPNADAAAKERIKRGEHLFAQVGCTACHVPSLRLESRVFLEPNPYNRPGTITPEDVGGVIALPLAGGDKASGIQSNPDGSLSVFAYSDLKRHVICDADEPFFCNERLRQDNVPTDEFLTPKLWDLATSAPYGHRGDCGTLSEAVLHHGGEAKESREQFLALPDDDKRALIAFLLSLGAGDE